MIAPRAHHAGAPWQHLPKPPVVIRPNGIAPVRLIAATDGNQKYARTIVSLEDVPGHEPNTRDAIDAVADVPPGTYHIRVRLHPYDSHSSREYAVAVWLLGPENDTFDIEVRYVESLHYTVLHEVGHVLGSAHSGSATCDGRTPTSAARWPSLPSMVPVAQTILAPRSRWRTTTHTGASRCSTTN